MTTINMSRLLTMALTISIIVNLVCAQDETFSKAYQGCAPNQLGDNCPKMWHVTGGPGWLGQRASYDNGRGVRMICTPSCTSLNNPKECSLIIALHGIYSNPGDQEWLMIGNGNGAYDESVEAGGPFCISFHKSEDFPWQYHCEGSDHLHLYSFIDYAMTQWPIDNHRVNIHGFSSGGIHIHRVMNTHCDIESRIAVASSYGSGNVHAPPSTRAAYLLVHGTQDGIVTYESLWDYDRNTQAISCCDAEWDGTGNCDPEPLKHYHSLYAESLAAAIATNRGYNGDVIGGTHPGVSKTLRLVDDNVAYCNQRMDKCLDPHGETPNPWNDKFTCPADPNGETDVLEYPVASNKDGKVQVWRMNTWNHDYPNKRAEGEPWGVTVFFLELRKFFYENRGLKTYNGVRSVIKADDNKVLCGNPYWQDKPLPFTNDLWYPEMTEDRCREICLNDYLCKDAFYIDISNYVGYQSRNCQIWFNNAPCFGLTGADWAIAATHFQGSTSNQPTSSPIPTNPPVATPTSPTNPPTKSTDFCPFDTMLMPDVTAGYSCFDGLGDSNSGYTEEDCDGDGGTWVSYSCQIASDYYPTNPQEYFLDWWVPKCCEGEFSTPTPQLQLCDAPEILVPSNLGGYVCLVNGVSNWRDSNDGYTENECVNAGGEWTPYTCDTAEEYWDSVEDEGTKDYLKENWWEPKCCEEEQSPTPAPPPQLCDAPEILVPSNLGGYACLVNGVSIRDSNDGYTENECVNAGGEWTLYTCDTAEEYWDRVEDEGTKDYLKENWWEPKCCAIPANPTPSPTDKFGCPSACSVPNCIGLNEGGPGWNNDWVGDNGDLTSNGFCTSYCKEYDPENAPGKHLCGSTDWHMTGIECSNCDAWNESPILEDKDTKPSSGLCAETGQMSDHVIWGKGVKECNNGPHPTSEDVCTVHQSVNGDSVINPQRTCRGFCNHFGLACLNGFDDGDNDCTYGGVGIGCDSILGCCSDGGPTPDHVCVCGRVPTDSPTDSLSVSPTTAPTSCQDSTRTFLLNQNPRKCDWVAEDSTARCSMGRGKVATHCPKTCGTCGDCVDAKLKFYLTNNSAKQCKWVQKRNKCDMVGDDWTCRKTCGNCANYSYHTKNADWI